MGTSVPYLYITVPSKTKSDDAPDVPDIKTKDPLTPRQRARLIAIEKQL